MKSIHTLKCIIMQLEKLLMTEIVWEDEKKSFGICELPDSCLEIFIRNRAEDKENFVNGLFISPKENLSEKMFDIADKKLEKILEKVRNIFENDENYLLESNYFENEQEHRALKINYGSERCDYKELDEILAKFNVFMQACLKSEIAIPEKQEEPIEEKPVYDTNVNPLDLYKYLDERVIGQEEAKRVASTLMCDVLKGDKPKKNIIFVGPSGSGKTYIWHCLREKYPDKIDIADVSGVTLEGYVGETKWKSLINKYAPTDGSPKIIVFDEIDKLISPRNSAGGHNISETLMGEALKIIEGTEIVINETVIDTSNISFVLCGAFVKLANNIATESNKKSIGFVEDKTEKHSDPYEKKLTRDDIVKFGATNEFMGRINQIVNLRGITVDDYRKALESESRMILNEIEKEYDIKVSITKETVDRLVSETVNGLFGMRNIRNEIRNAIDAERFYNYNKKEFTI